MDVHFVGDFVPGRKRIRLNRKTQHTSWVWICMLVHVCGRGCIVVLGVLVFPVLIARGGVAISMIPVTALFILGPG